MKTQLTEEEELYKENIIDHYKNPRNKGVMKEFTFCHRELNPLCGDEITLFVKLENNIVSEISFIGKGCAISLAATSMLTEKIINMNVEQIKKLGEKEIKDMLNINISPARIKCALLSLNTFLRGLNHVRS